MTTLHQDASESVVSLLLAVETVAAEEVGVSIEEVVSEDVDEVAEGTEEDTSKKVVEGGSSAHENGIDISYVIRYFEYSEWDAHSNDTRKRITEDPVCTKFL